jgi:glycosyltransferase involved in cell wall biosynthesis
LAVVASKVGVNAEYVCDGVNGFHAINTSQWIDEIGELIKNAELRKKLVRKGMCKFNDMICL